MQRILEIAVNPCSAADLALRREQNARIEAATKAEKPWYTYPSVADFRATGMPAHHSAWLNPAADIIDIPSTYGNHTIQLRRIVPTQGEARGVWLHFHAGGFVVGSNSMCDSLLTTLADSLSLTLVSVEYRLAPEHLYPAAAEDCLDAALYALSDEGAAALGGRLRFMGGESAGGYLTVQTALALREKGVDVKRHLDGLICHYGIYDLTYTPSLLSHEKEIILSRECTIQCIDTAFPSGAELRKEGRFSPLYANLERLPPALFLVGPEDPLYDDSVFMAAKWAVAGNETSLKIVAEAFHGFTLLPCAAGEEGIAEVIKFVKAHC
ncbi:carboxylesterase [Macrophomina phaseolina]|uniref:Carboxylesterase n=1 Tax=Macrophomina phaseolina TaxID=35725 RepID=A0ABQ8GAG4_9PEZI|nr:carboxylesterase [Macrophomina phaseolina]